MTRLSVKDRLERGDVLRMQIRDGRREWWFECPYQSVNDDAVNDYLLKARLVECGDSLFGMRNNSQTWMLARETVQ